MNYTLHQLKILVKVADLKSITKASEELFLTQPAVSIQLKKLQDQFDIPITEIVGRQLYITDFGEKVVEVSKKILEEAELLHSTINQFKGFFTGKISFSIVSTAKYVLPYFIKDFINKHKQVQISIDVTNKSKVISSLEANSTDFALISILPNENNFEKVELIDNHLYMIGSGKIKSKFNFNDAPLIFREEGSATRVAMEDYLKNRNLKYNKRLELVSNEAVKQAILAGIGYSIMPIIGLKDELQNGGLKIIKQPKLPIISQWYLVYNKGKKLTPAQNEFITFLKLNKEKIAKENFGWENDFIQ